MSRLRRPDPILGETPVMTRDQASLAGWTVYFTGKLCTNGHLDWRYVSTTQCRGCTKPMPPPQPWRGDDGGGLYRVTLTRRVRVPVSPPIDDAQQMQRFDAWLEKAAREWLKNYGYWTPSPDTSEM